MATTIGNNFTPFHSIDALLGGSEVNMFGQEYLKRFPVPDGKAHLNKVVDFKSHRQLVHGSQTVHQTEGTMKTKRDMGEYYTCLF